MMKLIKLTAISIIIWLNEVRCYPEIKESCEYEGDDEFSLSEAGYIVILDGMENLEANSRSKITLGEDHTITLSLTGEGPKYDFIGYLVRLGANTNIVDPETVDARDNMFMFNDTSYLTSNTIQMLQCDTGIKDYYVSALSNVSNDPVEFVSFQIRKDEEDELRMEVWMVADDDEDDDYFYHDTYDFSFI